jgi:hypothetical protein
MVNVSADSVAVMPRTPTVTVPNRIALASANSAPAYRADGFLEKHDRRDGRKKRRGEIDRDRARERHQAECDDEKSLRTRLGDAAQHVVAQPLGAKYGKPGHGQDHEGRADQRRRSPCEQHLADRIGGHEPLGKGA